jgi:hypothetical protein
MEITLMFFYEQIPLDDECILGPNSQIIRETVKFPAYILV